MPSGRGEFSSPRLSVPSLRPSFLSLLLFSLSSESDVSSAGFDAVDGERGDALALGFETLDADVTLGVDVKRIAESLGAAIGDAQAGVGLVGEQDKARGRVVADEARVTVARRTFESEPLDVREALLVGVKKDGSPDCVGGEFFDA